METSSLTFGNLLMDSCTPLDTALLLPAKPNVLNLLTNLLELSKPHLEVSSMEKLSRLQDNSLLLKKIITPLLPPVTRPTLKSEDFSNKLVTTGTKPSKLDLDLRDSLSTPSRLKLILPMEKLP